MTGQNVFSIGSLTVAYFLGESVSLVGANKRVHNIPIFGWSGLRRFLCLWLTVIGAWPVVASDFYYDLDTNLTYIDRLKNPTSIGSNRKLDELRGQQARTLGLTKMRVGLHWEVIKQSRFNLALRPDALLRRDEENDEEARDFDSRSGPVYRRSSVQKFADAYSIEALLGQHFGLGVGVYERIAERYLAYSEILEFGLNVRMIEKYSGAAFSWKSLKHDADFSPQKYPSGYHFQFIVFQGNGDRAEKPAHQKETFDQAPAAEDDHYGVAVELIRFDGKTNRLGLVLGISDHKDSQNVFVTDEENQTEEEIIAYGKRNEFFAQIFNEAFLDNTLLPLKLSADLRYAKEKWKGDLITYKPRIHQSYSLSCSGEVLRRQWVLLGLHWGESRFNNATNYTGYQIDLGYQIEFREGLELGVMGSDEHRNGTGGSGAFTNEDGEKSLLRRFAIQVRYLIGGNS